MCFYCHYLSWLNWVAKNTVKQFEKWINYFKIKETFVLCIYTLFKLLVAQVDVRSPILLCTRIISLNIYSRGWCVQQGESSFSWQAMSSCLFLPLALPGSLCIFLPKLACSRRSDIGRATRKDARRAARKKRRVFARRSPTIRTPVTGYPKTVRTCGSVISAWGDAPRNFWCGCAAQS